MHAKSITSGVWGILGSGVQRCFHIASDMWDYGLYSISDALA